MTVCKHGSCVLSIHRLQEWCASNVGHTLLATRILSSQCAFFFFQNMNMAFNCALSKVACVRLDSSCACKACLTTSPLLSIFRVLLWTWLSCFLKDPESSDKSLGACSRVVGGRSSTGNERAIALGVFSSCLFTRVWRCWKGKRARNHNVAIRFAHYGTGCIGFSGGLGCFVSFFAART